MNNKNIKTMDIIKGALYGVAMLLLATAVGLAFIQITNLPYTVDVKALNISETSGLPESEIMENYKAVMTYLSPMGTAQFDLPTLKFSPEGAGHFADCKRIFSTIYMLGMFAAALLFNFFAKRYKAASPRLLKASGFVTLGIPALLGLAIATNFDRVFVLFHKVFFKGDTWIFDPSVDEIIKILPEQFFMHCALVVVAFWVVAGAVLLVLGFRKKNSEIPEEQE